MAAKRSKFDVTWAQGFHFKNVGFCNADSNFEISMVNGLNGHCFGGGGARFKVFKFLRLASLKCKSLVVAAKGSKFDVIWAQGSHFRTIWVLQCRFPTLRFPW